MLNKEEKEILFTYDLNKPVSIGRYLTDFIFKNPYNFNISAFVMSVSKDTVQKVSEHYTADNIKVNIMNFVKNYDCIRSFSLFNHNFTSALLMISNKLVNDWRYDSNRYNIFDVYMTILQKDDNDMVVSIKSQYRNYIVFDTNYTNSLFVIDSNNYPMFVNDFIIKNNKPFGEFVCNENFDFDGLRIPYPNLTIDDSENHEDDTLIDKYKQRFDSFVSLILTDSVYRRNRENVIGDNSICYYFKYDLGDLETSDEKYRVSKITESIPPITSLSNEDEQFLKKSSGAFLLRPSNSGNN